ncbi:MAG: helicase [Gammaproteobacteria bacterium]|nr:helicase [Gammaproteobacteria bacterium]
MEAIALIDDTLASLKDFQKATVKSAIHSFDSGASQRVLVADEVGLGKTIVAKGVIAELLKQRLFNQKKGGKITPLRVTYICSNLTLADENRKKLAVFYGEHQEKYVRQPSYSRLLDTAVTLSSEGDEGKILEVCSLTPSTSFNLTRGEGNWRERMIIFAALIDSPDLYRYRRKLSNFFSGYVSKDNWREREKSFIKDKTLDSAIVAEFHQRLIEQISNKTSFGHALSSCTWLDAILDFCSGGSKLTGYENAFRASLRSLMAEVCAKKLTADLFILDEFQRFKALLNSNQENEESLIAKEIFNKKQSKILLLSATPFKAISQAEDDEEGDSHAEELNYLLNFLTLSNQRLLLEYEHNRKALQQQILQLKDADYSFSAIESQHKLAIENLLGPFLCRTERAQISDGYENLFCSSVPDDMERIKDFSTGDIEAFKALDQLGLALQENHPGRSASQLMEFYKAAPWPLSFISGYQFKKNLDESSHESDIKKALKKSAPAWLLQSDIQSYKINLEQAPHAKMRALTKQLFKDNSEELLWVPPSLPDYPLQGSFENQQDFSKTLLFSSWAMVPRALSGLISYESERRLLHKRQGLKKAYFKDASHTPKIRFDESSSWVGWSLVYPSKTLIDMSLPAGDSLSFDELLTQRIVAINEKLSRLLPLAEEVTKRSDRWYAIAPMLLDLHGGNDGYFYEWLSEQRKSISKRKDNKGITAQFEVLSSFLEDEHLALGSMPVDLAEYLAYLSIAGPAVSIYRAWRNNWPAEASMYASSATAVAFAVVSMFNKPESESILGKRYGKLKYFDAIARYCTDGGFQAVANEYAHLLKGDGFSMRCEGHSATERMIEVLSLMTSNVACQFSENRSKSSENNESQAKNKHSLRCHYAVPLGTQEMSSDAAVQRVGSVRDAFNSPFRPFVLNSTSIGQEGLDFHWYCSQIVHWNLPANPIDIEQREGRINRYKSLTVRKRLAEVYKEKCTLEEGDPWRQLFHFADTETSKNGRSSDLVPYWHLPEGSAKIERFVPMMPLSRDVLKLDHALRVLAIYRLAFGQPRQEELLDNLLKRDFKPEEIELITKNLVINLSPMKR